MDINALQQQKEQQLGNSRIADAFYTHQLMNYVSGQGTVQGVRNAAVRRLPTPEYNSEFDAFVANSGNVQQKRSSINIDGVSTVASPHSLSDSMSTINDNSQSNIM